MGEAPVSPLYPTLLMDVDSPGAFARLEGAQHWGATLLGAGLLLPPSQDRWSSPQSLCHFLVPICHEWQKRGENKNGKVHCEDVSTWARRQLCAQAESGWRWPLSEPLSPPLEAGTMTTVLLGLSRTATRNTTNPMLINGGDLFLLVWEPRVQGRGTCMGT